MLQAPIKLGAFTIKEKDGLNGMVNIVIASEVLLKEIIIRKKNLQIVYVGLKIFFLDVMLRQA